jgi:hypothetical protein
MLAYGNERAERQRAMCCGHCLAIQPLAICCAMTTQAITAAVDAGHFGVHRHAADEQYEREKSKFHLRDFHHHMAAQTSMIAPSGSGAANAPNIASAAGDRNRFLNDRRSMQLMAKCSTRDG